MQLLLARHGATLYNEQKRYMGQADVTLSSLGEHQAIKLGTRLATEQIDVIVTSDLQRARATAAVIARFHKVPVYEDFNIREISRGVWEGATYAELVERDAELMALWQSDPASCRIPGGETLTQLQIRVVHALEYWYTQYPEATIVWVTHEGVIRVLLCHLLNVNLNGWKQFKSDNASIIEVKVSRADEVLVGRLSRSLAF